MGILMVTIFTSEIQHHIFFKKTRSVLLWLPSSTYALTFANHVMPDVLQAIGCKVMIANVVKYGLICFDVMFLKLSSAIQFLSQKSGLIGRNWFTIALHLIQVIPENIGRATSNTTRYLWAGNQKHRTLTLLALYICAYILQTLICMNICM